MKNRKFLTAASLIFSTSLAMILFSGCASQPPDEPAGEPSVARTASLNALSPAEQAQGWTLLFDGQRIDQWRGYRQDDVPAGWVVTEDGTLHFTGENGGDIITRDQYESFELDLEWKISERGNSGIFFHVAEAEQYPTVWRTGPEYQILDDAGYDNLNDNQLTGSNYDLHAPSRLDLARPAGEWNHTRIVVDGPRVEHWLNGQKVVDYELWSDEWEALVADSKFGDSDYGRMRRGHIALQDHGDPVWFRNIKVRSLN